MSTSAGLCGRCDQQQFSSASLVKALRIEHEQMARFTTLAIESKTTPGRGIDVEIALSVLTQAICSKLAVDVGAVTRSYNPLINAALLHLASNPAHWDSLEDERGEPRSLLFDEGEGIGLRRRRIQELFGFHECPTHRYLVRRPGENWSVSDNIGDKIASGKEPIILALDAFAVADKFSSSVSGPFFIWKSLDI